MARDHRVKSDSPGSDWSAGAVVATYQSSDHSIHHPAKLTTPSPYIKVLT